MSNYRIYTDGSGHNEKAGALAIIFKKGNPQALKSLTYHLGDLKRHTINDAKMVSTLLASWLIHTTPGSTWSSFSIYTDSQALVQALTRWTTSSGRYLINALHSVTDNMCSPLKVNWIPEHSKIKGNVEADELAKLAASGQSSPAMDLPLILHNHLPYSADAEKQTYLQEIKAMWMEQWQGSPRSK